MISSVCAKAVFLKNFNPIKFADRFDRARQNTIKKTPLSGSFFYGGRSRDRTCDPYRVKVMLYR